MHFSTVTRSRTLRHIVQEHPSGLLRLNLNKNLTLLRRAIPSRESESARSGNLDVLPFSSAWFDALQGAIALLEQRLHVAPQKQLLGEAPDWPEGSREGEAILHVGAAVDLGEEMLVVVGGERAADLFIRKPVRSIHIKNSDRQPQR